jgi:hypothetical protein
MPESRHRRPPVPGFRNDPGIAGIPIKLFGRRTDSPAQPDTTH